MESISKIKIAGTVNDSVVDGPGLRLAVFFQGCEHHCVNCHNQDTHDINGGYEINLEEIYKMINANPLLDGITISGGEPLLQAEGAGLLAAYAKNKGLSVVVFTGFVWEEIINNYDTNKKLLNYTDYLIDGKYIHELRSLDLFYKGSENQRIIDVKQSLLRNEVVEVEKFKA